MSTSIAVRNAACNWTGLAIQMLVGFLILPFLIQHLGQSTYGLWLLIGSLTGYFGVLDFGVGGSVARNVAFFKAKNDFDTVNGLVSTAIAYLMGVAVLALAAAAGAALIFFRFFRDVPPHLQTEVRLAIILVGLNLALTLPLSVFDGVLWAYERFDLQNAVDVPAALLRAGLTYHFIGAGRGLAALAMITLSTGLLASLCKALLGFRVARGLSVSPRWASLEQARVLFSYGIWYFLLSLTRSLAPQLTLIAVGVRLGTEQVTPYSVATRLVAYANSFLIAGTQVMTPVATTLHAQERGSEQRNLFLKGGKFCLALALFFLSLFVLLGPALLRLWTGLHAAYPLLLILSLGELIPMSQWITYSVILGKGRHKALAWASIVEVSGVAGFAFALAEPFGLLGVCTAIAVFGGLCRGVFQWLYACKLVDVPPQSYLLRVMLPTLFAVAGPVLLLGLLTWWYAPVTWLELLVYGLAYTMCYFVVAAVFLLDLHQFRMLGGRIFARWDAR